MSGTLRRKTERRQYVKREYYALKEEIDGYLREGWTVSDIYRSLRGDDRIRMSYQALCQCINGKYDAMNLNKKKASELAAEKVPAVPDVVRTSVPAVAAGVAGGTEREKFTEIMNNARNKKEK